MSKVKKKAMVRLVIMVEPETKTYLEKRRKKTDISVGEMAREGINQWIVNNKKK